MKKRNKVILFYGLFFKDQSYGWFPDSILFVYSLLKDAGFEPILIHEYGHENYEAVLRQHADETLFLGISSMTGPQIIQSIECAKKFKKYAPTVPVLWGGGHPTAAPYVTLQSKWCDIVYVGFAKHTLVTLAKALQEGEPVEGIPDVLTLDYFLDQNTTDYSIQDPLVDYSSFPPLALQDMDYSYLLTANRVLNYTSSTGCRGACSFCTWGGKHPWTHRPLDIVLDEIEYLTRRYNLRSLWISDASLTADREYMLSLAQGILERDLGVWWRCHGRVLELRHFSRDDFRLLEESGLDRIFIGVENVDQEIQKQFYKVYNPEYVTALAETMSGFKIQLYMSFIFGNPNETPETLHKNRAYLDKWKAINPRIGFQVCFFTPYPGTTKLVERLGYVPPVSLEEYGTSPFFDDIDRKVMLLPWFEDEERERYLETYKKLFPHTEAAPRWNWRDEA